MRQVTGLIVAVVLGGACARQDTGKFEARPAPPASASAGGEAVRSLRFADETPHKLVLVGPRGAATHVLERRPRDWRVADWYSEAGLGKPGEPVMDLTSMNTPLSTGAAHHRVYLFGFGISAADLQWLGPQTKLAMVEGAARLVVVLDGSDDDFAEAVDDVLAGPDVEVSVIAIGRSAATSVVVAGRTLPVTPLPDAEIAGWLSQVTRDLIGAE